MDVATAVGAAMRRCLAAMLLLLAVTPAAARGQQRYALVVTGASGGEEVAERHARWRQALVSSLTGQLEFPPSQVVVLAERPGAGERPATRDEVRKALGQLASVMFPDDELLVVLIGHGTFDGVDAKFNLVGPDLDAREWAALMRPVQGRLVIVDTTSASFPFLAALAVPGRVVMTATDSSAQEFSTVFAEYFADALVDPESDIDKNGRVSVWETFVAASAKVRHHYEQRGQLAIERPLLDDTGDGVGKEAGGPGPDGPLAARTFLDARPAPPDADPELVELYLRRATLEAEAEQLKVRKPLLPDGDYGREFERLMIELARVSRAIRLKRR
jgi:hypothetical protein